MWNPDILKQGEIHALREAAERAWGDDTRDEAYRGSQRKSAGQCYNTSRWLQSRLGGSVGRVEGHYVWLSPDHSHVVDLTGDQFGKDQIMFKQADHHLFEGVQPVDPAEFDDQGTKVFINRANREFDDLGSHTSKIALDYAGDAFPAQEPERATEIDNRYWHKEPQVEGDRGEYKFVYANGQLEVSPFESHEDLARAAGIDLDNHTGPVAVGYISVDMGMANWSITSNVGSKAIVRVLKDYTDNVGWKWGGLTDIEGEPMGTGSEFAPKKTHRFRQVGDRLYIGPRDADLLRQAAVEHDEEEIARSLFGTIDEQGCISNVFTGPEFLVTKGRDQLESLIASLQEYTEDQGLTLLSGDGAGGVGNNVVKKIEDLELDNLGSPNDNQNERAFFPKVDTREPSGTYQCPDCQRLLPTWRAYTLHRLEHEPPGDEPIAEDSGFPEINMDATFPPHFIEQKPEVFPIAHVAEAERCDGFKVFANSMDIDAEDRHYVAFLSGNAVGFGTVSPGGELKAVNVHRPVTHHIMNRIRRDFPELHTSGGNFSDSWLKHAQFVETDMETWRYAAGKDPKDMIEAEVPFIFDVQEDQIYIGHPGTKTSEIPGRFTPGGIVEGTYEPGGKVFIRSLTTMPYSIRHLIELWYYSHPHLEVKSVHLQDDEGKDTKLASRMAATPDIGTFIRARVAADPVASQTAKALQKAGGQVLVVGGAVRDAVLGKEPKDIDLMVAGIPADHVEKALKALPGKVDYTGKDFGVFRVNMGGGEVEVAMPRRERSTGDKHTDFDVQSDHTMTPEEDLYRRDFTANAMGVDLGTGHLIDPFGGADDIANGRLKTVHEHALAEDPLRVARALTVRARHGLEPDEGTRAQMAANSESLTSLPQERIRRELDKIMKSDDPVSAIRLAHETGALKHILPEVDEAFGYDQNNPHHEQELGEHLLSVLGQTAALSKDPDVRLAALLHDIGKPASAWVDPVTGKNHFYHNKSMNIGANHEDVGADMTKERLESLKYPTDRTKRVSELVQHHMFPWFETEKGARRFVNKVGDHAEDLMDIREADNGGKMPKYDPRGNLPLINQQRDMINSVREGKQPTDRSMLAINGNDLLGLGLKGPEIGKELDALTHVVIDDPNLNNRETLLQMVKEQL